MDVRQKQRRFILANLRVFLPTSSQPLCFSCRGVIEIRMTELLQNFLSLSDLEMRVNVELEKAKQDLCFFECRFLSKVFGTRVFPKLRVSKAEEKPRCFSSCALSKEFS